MTDFQYDPDTTVAIRERDSNDPPGGKQFIVYNPQNGNWWFVFGFVQGGDTREEAVFWAERLASKNGFKFQRLPGWEGVDGALPQRPGKAKAA